MTNKPISTDIDPIETKEWLDALASVVNNDGPERAQFILNKLAQSAGTQITGMTTFYTPYINTISPDNEPEYPGDEELERHINGINRWNAACMVLNATKQYPELGGHLSTYASSVTLYAVGQNHFFKGDTGNGGDLVFFQGHASPGMYAQAFLEGRITEEQIKYFRQDVDGKGVTSYPHPYLMPDFWQFPTVSMGLGPIQAIYQARFLKYLQNRGLQQTEGRTVWAFCGDGEMDEPESTGALHIASKEVLDNLIFVINCNLQRLDGPVRGNGSIVNEMEGVFAGSGWRVIKVLWGRQWDELFDRDKNGLIMKRLEECVDGDLQTYRARDGKYIREHFFGKYPELLEIVKDKSDADIWHLTRGGHDLRKVYAAFKAAVETKGQPAVILAQTVKGYGIEEGASQNIAHNLKKLELDAIKKYRDRCRVPVSDDVIADVPFYRPDENSKEVQYIKQCREKLGGYVPSRRQESELLTVPPLEKFAVQLKNTGDREISSTMAFVRVLSTIMKDKTIGNRVVPIVPDESRTFGMEGMFRQFGIYSPIGQLYEPEDKHQIMYYKEAKDGQIFEEGLNEGGAFCSFMAAGTSYSVNNFPMIPVYVYYSMFGFQRTGDLAYAAGDAQTTGFLIGAVSGRTTLAGEGLQHQDGHNHIIANTIPNCVTYDPCYSYEVAVIMQDGLRRMYQDGEKVFYYITVCNESYYHPDMPEGVEDGILKGMYQIKESDKKAEHKVQLLGAGMILREAEAAAEILETEFNIAADVWSVTSFNELARDGLDVARWNMFHPEAEKRESYIMACLKDRSGPVVAATDCMKLYSEQVRAFIPQTYLTLGTDGFGRSDTRAQLRKFFEVNKYYIVVAALAALAEDGKVDAKVVADAMKKYGIDPEKPNPLYS